MLPILARGVLCQGRQPYWSDHLGCFYSRGQVFKIIHVIAKNGLNCAVVLFVRSLNIANAVWVIYAARKWSSFWGAKWGSTVFTLHYMIYRFEIRELKNFLHIYSEPVLRDHFHERPQAGLTFQCNWTRHQRPPVLRDHIFMANGVGFQGRFYRIYCIYCIFFSLLLYFI